MPHPITKSEAQDVLSPYIDDIRSLITETINGYYSAFEHSSLRVKLSRRSHASICHDLVVNAIIERFEGVKGFGHLRRRGLFLLSVQGRILLRFNMFDQNLMSHGIETKQLVSLRYQDVSQLEFEDYPPDGLLHVGYCLNALETGVEHVYVTYRFGKINVWEWELTQTQQTVVDQIQFTTQTNTKPAAKRMPKLKTKNVGDISETL
ncbi:hypothetical protein BK131_03590 [Paenibacillus amylolyticus]|uniref:Uncharacterized protein n=1 Tax=Paenibacillus amylolyticus TaxID=1451 RepID=A0A1R1C4U9_PAEAM|nr:hypothetical protein [Paenibacillus amylolyticus]OMF17067.1 hypothetical protein BK131_03590 [Paenibacillus amylolyticus]